MFLKLPWEMVVQGKNKDHRVFLDGVYKFEKTKGIEN